MFPSPEKLEISCEELQALREAGEPFRLVDCREEDEWNICRIEGAELAPLSSFAEDAYLLIARTDAAVKSAEDARRPGGPPLIMGASAEGGGSS
ncbi:MAG: rhodanese-like domain-containing protein, partial [Verrucomicrobiaceae bacterium]